MWKPCKGHYYYYYLLPIIMIIIEMGENNTIEKIREIEKMWQLKTTGELVIVGALGMIQRETDKHIKLPGNRSLYDR